MHYNIGVEMQFEYKSLDTVVECKAACLVLHMLAC